MTKFDENEQGVQRPPYVLHFGLSKRHVGGVPSAHWEVHKRTPEGFEVVVNQLNLTPLRFDSKEAAQEVLETLTINKLLDKVFG